MTTVANFTFFIQKKSAAEALRIFAETYGDLALSETACRDEFRCFKNNNFYVEDKERSGKLKKLDDEELEALLHEDSCQAQAQLAESLGVGHTMASKHLKALGMILKQAEKH